MDSPEVAHARTELLARLAHLLPPNEHTVLIRLFGLRPEGEQTYAEAGEELGISVATVKLRRRRALQRLRGDGAIIGLLRLRLSSMRQMGRIHPLREDD